MSIQLKSVDDINALITGPDYGSVPLVTKEAIALHFEEMPATVWEAALAVLVATLPTTQADFAQALFSDDAPTAPGIPLAPSPLSGAPYVIPMIFQGTVANNQTFGWFLVPCALTLTVMQLTLQQQDPDAGLTVVLVSNYDGTTIADSNYPEIGPAESFQTRTLGTPKQYQAGDVVVAKVIDYTPGSNGPQAVGLTCNLTGYIN